MCVLYHSLPHSPFRPPHPHPALTQPAGSSSPAFQGSGGGAEARRLWTFDLLCLVAPAWPGSLHTAAYTSCSAARLPLLQQEASFSSRSCSSRLVPSSPPLTAAAERKEKKALLMFDSGLTQTGKPRFPLLPVKKRVPVKRVHNLWRYSWKEMLKLRKTTKEFPADSSVGGSRLARSNKTFCMAGNH